MKRSEWMGIALLVSAFVTGASAEGERPAVDWPAYGRDEGGTRYAPLSDVTPANVADLEVAWTYRTGHL